MGVGTGVGMGAGVFGCTCAMHTVHAYVIVCVH